LEKGTGGPGSPAEVPVRFLALTIDGILVGAMWVVISLVASALRGAPVLGILAWVVLALAGALVSVGYLPYSYARYQATVGKSLMGVKVVDEISGGRLPPDRAVIRGIVQAFISGVFFGFGYWWIFLDPERKTLHDRMAGSSVVYRDEADRPPHALMLDHLRGLFSGRGGENGRQGG